MLQRTVFANGLRVVSKTLVNTASVTFLILVGAGSRYETKAMNGISHFLEHMFFKGAETYKSTKEVSEAIDGVGGDFNAFTGKEYAGYYIKVAAENQDLALNVLADMLIHSKFDPKEIDKERGVILEEYNMYQDTPMYQIGWDFERLIYGDQPMGYDQVGTKELIGSVTQAQFLDYRKKLYTPDNTVIAVAGNIEHADAVAKIEKLFKFETVKKQMEFAPLTGLSREKMLYLRNKKTEQAHIVVGYPGYSETAELIFPAKIVSIILGGNMSSRMFLNVREAQGLAYYISTSTDEYIDTGTLTTSAGVSVERIDQAISAVIDEYKKAAESGFTEKELRQAKDFLKGKLVLRLEDSEEYAHLLGKYELITGEAKSPEEIMTMVEGVTLEQANQVAKELFVPSELRMAIIGPYEDEERFLKLMI